MSQTPSSSLTRAIFLGLVFGILTGVSLKYLVFVFPESVTTLILCLETLGRIFVLLLKMLIVPIIFVSLVAGTAALGDPSKLGRVGVKTIVLYLFTTAFAISLALGIATLCHVGEGANLETNLSFTPTAAPSLQATLLNLFPKNPIEAFANGNTLQIILFSLFLGITLSLMGDQATQLKQLFEEANALFMKMITLIIQLAPIGIFCLISTLFCKQGFDLIKHLLGYFLTVIVVLAVQFGLVYALLLAVFARLNPLPFYRKIYTALMFAFSTSSSNVSIPITLATVEDKLGVDNQVAAFIIPLGATVNMDGSAILQGVATVFIANVFNLHLGFTDYLTVIGMSTLASIGTAGVPGVALITLAMVLQQVGLPVEGIAIILGVDRILDMIRTAVNITGDASIACIVGRSEKAFDLSVYQR